MKTREESDLFNFIKEQVEFTARDRSLKEPQAFARWFLEMYFSKPNDVRLSDGTKDGKIDAFFKTDNDRLVRHHVVNSKYTDEFGKLAPVAFYDEIIAFKHAFENKDARASWLANGVKQELAPRYRTLLEQYDEGNVQLIFVTNCRKNSRQLNRVGGWGDAMVFHLEELFQHVIDDLDVAMPRTSPLALNDIANVLAADPQESGVPTSIVFARLIDFVEYLRHDPHNLLLARNVRVYKGLTPTNKDIRRTFLTSPEEFVFSNNGITILCEESIHNTAKRQLTLTNPRVVNGGQTLISIRDLEKPSRTARVMVRIVTIRPLDGDLPREYEKKRDVIRKIAERSNMQNPIEKFDLRSFDDFHLDVYRDFRRRNMFYERRPGEWGQRSRELVSVGIRRGPDIKELTRYIACFHYDEPKLGAVAAKKPEELLEKDPYAQIIRTPTELAYQITHVAWTVIDRRKRLAKKSKEISAYKGAMDMLLLSIVFKALRRATRSWGKPKLTTFLEERRIWFPLVRESVGLICRHYRKERSKLWRQSHEMLEMSRFVKNQSHVTAILNEAPNQKLEKAAKDLVAEIR